MDQWEIFRDQGFKIKAIKALRDQYRGLSLMEAKDIVGGKRPHPGQPTAARVNAILGTMNDPTPRLTNQFGQCIRVGDWVGYVSKTGSHTTRKLGIVYELAEKKVSSYPVKTTPAVRIDWQLDGSYCSGGEPPKTCNDRPSLVDVNNVFRVPAASDWRD